ncbi:hypothetical protein SynROS8604_01681 [Synechococcus sp. ROS8604]|nr:hypothetical protein SynROS8604_01681 [Synechococcus sp. ROS8604]
MRFILAQYSIASDCGQCNRGKGFGFRHQRWSVDFYFSKSASI